jgi:hypothetical protein
VQDGQASRAAERVVERRVAHQLLGFPRIFDDPLALRMVRPKAAEVLRNDPGAYDRSALARSLRAGDDLLVTCRRLLADPHLTSCGIASRMSP